MAEKVEKKEQNPKKTIKLPKHFWWYAGVSGAAVVIIASSLSYALYYRTRIVPHTMVAGVSVGGLTLAQANSKLADKQADFDKSTINLSYQDKTYPLTPSVIGTSFDTNQAVSEAYQTGRSGSRVRNFGSKLKALAFNHNFAVTMAPLTAGADTTLHTTVLKGVETPVVQTSINFTPGKVTVTAGKSGNALDETKFTNDLLAAFTSQVKTISITLNQQDPAITADGAKAAQKQASAILSAGWTLQANNQKIAIKTTDVAKFLTTQAVDGSLAVTVDQTKLASFVTDVSSEVSSTAVNATLVVNNGVVSVAADGKDGVGLDSDATASTITTAILAPTITNRTIIGVTGVTYPIVTAANFASLGINQLIGTGTTDFSGSPANRIANIDIGVSHISGQLVQPGATFSTVGALGPIDEAHGYVAGLVILNNQTLPADGGGLCQVSTTLFRSVLNAGLPVTARTPHSYEVSYYQRGVGPGLDATIYDPSPDFKWVNDTGHTIYIQGIIKDKTLTFNLFGTSDGRIASIDGPHTLSTTQPTGDPIMVNTDTLPAGTKELIDPPVPGAKTTATYTVIRNGQVINKQTFNSSYQAMPAQYLVGTGPAPAAPATPTP